MSYSLSLASEAVRNALAGGCPGFSAPFHRRGAVDLVSLFRLQNFAGEAPGILRGEERDLCRVFGGEDYAGIGFLLLSDLQGLLTKTEYRILWRAGYRAVRLDACIMSGVRNGRLVYFVRPWTHIFQYEQVSLYGEGFEWEGEPH